jgi:hypothetical protein
MLAGIVLEVEPKGKYQAIKLFELFHAAFGSDMIWCHFCFARISADVLGRYLGERWNEVVSDSAQLVFQARKTR